MLSRLVDRLISWAMARQYYSIVRDGQTYMERGWILKPNGMKTKGEPLRRLLPDWGVRVHHIVRDDPDEAMHDHPWFNVSVVLRGGYFEVVPADQKQHPLWDASYSGHARAWRGPGSVVLRKPSTRHRIVLGPSGEAWTLFITGPWKKDWGFYTTRGWVFWRTYLAEKERK